MFPNLISGTSWTGSRLDDGFYNGFGNYLRAQVSYLAKPFDKLLRFAGINALDVLWSIGIGRGEANEATHVSSLVGWILDITRQDRRSRNK
jgi:hypothetical protein